MPHLADFAAEMSHEITARGAISISVAATEQGEVVDAAAWGERVAGSGELVNPDTLYQSGSISKPVAAFGALRLVDQGRLDLDANINDALTSWKLPALNGWEPRVTIRHLLCHGGGLSVHGFGGYPYGSAVPSVVDVLDGTGGANSKPVRVENIPGLNHRYSGGGYTILQQLMIDVTGQSFPSLLDELVLSPAGMTSATYEQPLPERLISGAAAAHIADTALECGFHVYPEMAAAGLWCTPTDLARFAICVQRAIEGAQDALLSQKLAEDMVEVKFPGRGLGLALVGEDPNRRFGHGGANQGFLADMAGYVDGGWAYAVMTNSFAGGPLLSLTRNRVAELWEWPGYDPGPVPQPGPREDPTSYYLGFYETDEGISLQLLIDADGASLVVTDQAPLHLDFLSTESAIVRELQLEVNFELEDQKPRALTLRQHGKAIRAKKIDKDTTIT